MIPISYLLTEGCLCCLRPIISNIVLWYLFLSDKVIFLPLACVYFWLLSMSFIQIAIREDRVYHIKALSLESSKPISFLTANPHLKLIVISRTSQIITVFNYILINSLSFPLLLRNCYSNLFSFFKVLLNVNIIRLKMNLSVLLWMRSEDGWMEWQCKQSWHLTLTYHFSCFIITSVIETSPMLRR